MNTDLTLIDQFLGVDSALSKATTCHVEATMRHSHKLAISCGWATLLMATTCGAADAPRSESGRRSAPLPQLERLPVASLDVDVRADEGPLELWRHGVGHGGVNSDPLPGRVVAGAAKLRPRLVRIFIPEFFRGIITGTRCRIASACSA